MKKDFKLPASFQDESVEIDRALGLVGRLCFAVDWDEECDAELVREIGLTINEYLRKRNALESVFGRVDRYCDDEYKKMVITFRKRVK